MAVAPDPVDGGSVGELLSHVPADIRDVSFGTVVRGYDRREVDAYVKRVNRLIAELEISRSPESAVKHALDRVGEQTSGVLQRGREAADELTAAAMAEAEHATRRAKVEAQETLEKAQMQADQLRERSKEEAEEALSRANELAADRLEHAGEEVRALQEDAEDRLRALRAEIEAAAAARRRLLDELRQTAAQLEEFAGGIMTGVAPSAASEQPTEEGTARLPRRSGPRPPVRDRTRQPSSRSG
jgi:DivIVA domain-containing protein